MSPKRSTILRMGQAAYPGSVAVFAILFDVEHEAFEVFAFGVVNADRVVGGLRHLVQDAYVAACDGCGREDRRAEQFLRYGLRAGEREEDAAGLDL